MNAVLNDTVAGLSGSQAVEAQPTAEAIELVPRGCRAIEGMLVQRAAGQPLAEFLQFAALPGVGIQSHDPGARFGLDFRSVP